MLQITPLAGIRTSQMLQITQCACLGMLQMLQNYTICWSWNVSNAANYSICWFQNKSNVANYNICWFWNASNAVNYSLCWSWNASNVVSLICNICRSCKVPLLELVPWQKSGRLGELEVRISLKCGLGVSSLLGTERNHHTLVDSIGAISKIHSLLTVRIWFRIYSENIGRRTR